MHVQLSLLDEALRLLTERSEPHAAECEPHAAECSIAPGQLELFSMAPVTMSPGVGVPSTAVGNEGEACFEGICIAHDLATLKPLGGNPGWDYVVNGSRVNVKASRTIRLDGRIGFPAGSRGRYINYAGEVDYFAFIYIGPNMAYHRHMLILTAGEVLRRWPGSNAMLHPGDLRKTYDVTMLSGGAASGFADAPPPALAGEPVLVR